jgi:uncharacterized membrane protein YqgA involved in biofilm formation
MTTAHHLLGLACVAGSLVVVVAAAWSAIAAWRSGGRNDHRLLVDRAVLAVLGILVAAGLFGVGLLLAGSRPVDPLHLIYGPASLISLSVAIWIGARTASADGSRVRRDIWTAAGGVVLLGIVLRLFATG